MTTIEIVISGVYVMLAIVGYYFFVIRNTQVCEFRRMIVRMCAAYNIRHINDRARVDAFSFFLHKHTYNRMMFSMKPLRLESWYTEEEIELIKS